MIKSQKLKIYHDALLQNGGAEFVALTWAHHFSLPLNVIACDKHIKEHQKVVIHTLLRFVKNQKQMEYLYPILPLLLKFKSLLVDEETQLISSTGIAHLILNNKNKSILYLHSPTRWIWDKESFDIGRKKWQQVVANLLRPIFKRIDQKNIQKANTIIANSNYTKKRISDIYNRKSSVVFPPVRNFEEILSQPFLNLNFSEFVLSVGRNRGYKGFEKIVNISNHLNRKVILVGSGTQIYNSKNVHALGVVNDGQLKWLYENASCLLAISEEDFGLTPIEAASLGCPTIAFAKKGYLDSVKDNVSGKLIPIEESALMIRTLNSIKRVDFDLSEMQQFAMNFSVMNHMLAIEKVLYDD